MKIKCIVHGCKYHTHEGRFVGDLCAPCHTMLTSGEIYPSFAFFVTEIDRLRATNERLTDFVAFVARWAVYKPNKPDKPTSHKDALETIAWHPVVQAALAEEKQDV